MERVILDSDLYVDWIQAGRRDDLILRIPFVRYLSTVVLLELQAGAIGRKTADAVHELYRSYQRTSRVLLPSPAAFWHAGAVLRTLHERHGFDLRKRFRLTNDCLIAISIRQLGPPCWP